jgi:formylglycine-generating enzyme required for sulfatase activity
MASGSEKFDPYHKWLGIRPAEQPPNHYRLLGIGLFESDPDVITNAADRQMAHVRSFQSGQYVEETQTLLNELAAARVCLLDRQEKAAYDALLMETLSRLLSAAPASPPKPPRPLATPVPKSIGAYALIGGLLGFGVCVAVALFVFLPIVETPAPPTADTTRVNRQSPPPPPAQPPQPESSPHQPPAKPQPNPDPKPEPSPEIQPEPDPKPLPETKPEMTKSSPNSVTPAAEPQPESSPPKPSPEAEPKPATADKSPLTPAIAPFDPQQAQAFQEGWAQRLDLPVVLTNSVGMKLVFIPPGEFTMGASVAEYAWCMDYLYKHFKSEASRARGRAMHAAERPDRPVRIATPFYLGVHEVTQAEYATVMGRQLTGDGRLPVEGVSWDDAVKFCTRLSALPDEKKARRRYRLPSEAEWEYACRAGTTGYDLDFDSWHSGNSPNHSAHPVAGKPANPWQLCDMLGNVREWCANPFDADRFAQFPRKSGSPNAGYPLRGGSYNESSRSCRPTSRIPGTKQGVTDKEASSGQIVCGFRVCFSGAALPATAFAKPSPRPTSSTSP